MDKERLLHCLQQCEKHQQKRKRKQCFRTVFFYTVVLVGLHYWFGVRGIEKMLITAAFSFVFSFFAFFINLEIFGRLIEQDKEAEAALEYLRKRLREKEQENNH